MRYQELYTEYSELVSGYCALRMELNSLPKGYITVRKISGKDYHYLQHSANGRKESECLSKERLVEVKAGLARREELNKQAVDLNRELSRLENAAQILDADLHRRFFYLRQTAEMDAMPMEKRPKVLSFAKAMTALEGLQVQPETVEQLKQWAVGERKFADIYLPALQRYKVLGG